MVTRAGFVALAGRPNVGKSTLVNALAGGKVAIVSDKPQTTRRRIFGIANGPDYQLVLADLPGFQRPLDPLTEHMQRTVDSSFEDVDAALFVLSARERIGAGDRFIASRLFRLRIPILIALNKVDRLKPGHIATQMEAASRLGDFHSLHPGQIDQHELPPRLGVGGHSAHGPPCRLRAAGDDRDPAADDRVDQRRLADVRPPGEPDESRPHARSPRITRA